MTGQTLEQIGEQLPDYETLLAQRDAALRENEKLLKINQVLMRRVELGWRCLPII